MEAGDAGQKAALTKQDCNELLVIEVATYEKGKNILRDQFRLGHAGNIYFDNRYYSANVSVCLLSGSEIEPKMQEEDFRSSLKAFPALALITLGSNTSNLTRCKALAEEVCRFCSDSVSAVIYIHEADMSEEKTSEVIRWGLNHNIEVVTDSLCADDGLDVVTRLEQIFECAKWPKVSFKATRAPTGEHRDKANSGSQSDINNLKPGCDVSRPTRLRRVLKDEDVSKLVDDLLLDQSSESED